MFLFKENVHLPKLMLRFLVYNFKLKVLNITMVNTSTEWIKASITPLASKPIPWINITTPSIASWEEAHGSKSPPLCPTQGRPLASRSPCPSRASPGSTRGSRSPPPPSNASQDKPHIRRLEMQRSLQLSVSGHVASKSSSHGLLEARESVHHRQNESTAGLLSCEYTVAWRNLCYVNVK